MTIDFDSSDLDTLTVSAHDYEEATKTVVRTLGREAGCEVVFAGREAKVGVKKKGGRIVQLPSNPPDSKLSKKQHFIGQGFANHETLHNLCTDIDGAHEKMEALVKGGAKLSAALANGIEDVRIERAGTQLYPGAQDKLAVTAEFAAREFLKMDEAKLKEICSDFKKVGPIAMTWEGRKRMGYDAPSIQKCLDLLPPDVADKVSKYSDLTEKLPTGVNGIQDLDRTESFAGTHKGIDLAKLIAREILEEPPEEPPEEEEGDGDDGGDGDPDAEGEGEASRGKPGGNPDGEEDVGDSAIHTTEVDEPFNPDMLDQVKHILKSSDSSGYTVATTALDTIVKRQHTTGVAKETLKHEENLRDYTKASNSIRGKLAVMRRKMERALLAEHEVERDSGFRSGKLKVRGNVVKIMTGATGLFTRRTHGKDINTAVTLLIDASGSMHGPRIQLAQKCAIALAEVFVGVGVPLEILVFNTRHPIQDEFSSKEEYQERVDIFQAQIGDYDSRCTYGRADTMCLFEVKQFKDNMREARIGLGGINKMVSSANADADSVWAAWERLKKRPEARKVLFVLSDGQPSCGGDAGKQSSHLKRMVKDIAKQGGECFGLGIQSDDVTKYYPQHAVVNRIEDLPGVVIDRMSKILLGEKFQADNSKLNVK